MEIDYIVTIIVTVYNKEKFLERTLESILKQKTDYFYKVLIYNDGSTDGSRQIIDRYVNEYPSIFELYCNDINIGLAGTIVRAYRLTKTKYYTVLDADDYWVSEYKLDNALKYLEDNDDCSIYGSNYYLYSVDGQQSIAVSMEETFDTSDIFNMISLQTSATVYRNNFDKDSIDELERIIGDKRVHPFQADTFRNVIGMCNGSFHFSPEVESVYCMDAKGMWASLTELEKSVFNIYTYYSIFEYVLSKYGTKNKVAVYCLNYSKYFFDDSIDKVSEIMKKHDYLDWKSKKYIQDYFGISDSFNEILFLIVEFGRYMGRYLK